MGDRIWVDDQQCVMVAVMGGWVEEGEEQKLAGHTFCLTGTAWISRKLFVSMIQAEGGKFTPSMTLKSTILVNAHAGRAGMNEVSFKVQKAKKLGARIISAHNLKKILAGDVSLALVLGDIKKKRKPVGPIDRERYKQLVKETLANIESIAFGK